MLTNVHTLVWLPAHIECRKSYNKSCGAQGLVFQQRSSLPSPLRLALRHRTPSLLHQQTRRGQVWAVISPFLMRKRPRRDATAPDKVVTGCHIGL